MKHTGVEKLYKLKSKKAEIIVMTVEEANSIVTNPGKPIPAKLIDALDEARNPVKANLKETAFVLIKITNN